MSKNRATKTLIVGSIILASLFILGGILVFSLNSSSPDKDFRDLAIVIASTIAATGAISGAFIAFQSSRQVELEKDLSERRRRIDEERTKTDSALVSLHVAATFLDGYYIQIRKFLEPSKIALKSKNYIEHKRLTASLPTISIPFPLLSEIDIRFMRRSEQNAIRSIQVSLELIRQSIEGVREDVRLNKTEFDALVSELGEDDFFSALQFNIDSLERNLKSLFDNILPYINSRRPSAIPDESKLKMLLGEFESCDITIDSLEDAQEHIRIVASKLLREHVEAKDVRSLLRTVANNIKDEDSIPIGPTPP